MILIDVRSIVIDTENPTFGRVMSCVVCRLRLLRLGLEGTRQIAQLPVSTHHKGVSPRRHAYLPIAKRLGAKHYTLTKLTKLTGAAGGCAMPDHLTRRFPFTSSAQECVKLPIELFYLLVYPIGPL
jgi:hypothetical protein